MVTCADHIKWSGSGYVQSFGLKLTGSSTFLLILLFTACFKRNVNCLQGEYVLRAQAVNIMHESER